MLADIGTRPLAWVVSGGKNRTSVLRAGSDILGSLRFETESRAIGDIEGHTWILEFEGTVLQTHITIRAQGATEPVATFAQKWTGGGVVTFQNGVRYCWNPSHIWSTTHCFRREGKKASVCLAQGPADGTGSRVTICQDAAAFEETPVLVLLSGFLEVQILKKLSNATTL